MNKWIEAEVSTFTVEKRKRFEELVANGQSPSMALIFVDRKAPGVMTDDTMMAGKGTLDKQIPIEQHRNAIIKAARAQGYNPKPTDYYCPTMPGPMGHPDKWFNHGEGRSKMKRILEREGVESEGYVSTKGRNDRPPMKKKHQLHPRIVERRRKEMLKENPDLARKDQREVREMIIDKHGSKKKD